MAEPSRMREHYLGRVRAAELVTTDHYVASDTAGIELFVRNKRPAALGPAGPERTLLMVHGATYPAEAAFDLKLAGLSLMEAIAAHGFDVWLLDVRGYGRSTRPPAMEAPPADNAPIARTEVALRDVGTVVDLIRRERGLDRLGLLGWSWGTTLMGAVAAAHPDLVEKLVLLAPQWLRPGARPQPEGAPAADGGLGAYRTVTKDDARLRWFRGVAEDKIPGLLPAGWFDAWWDEVQASDPWGATQEPQVIRAPNGTLQDIRELWNAGTPVYDPGRIVCPVLAIHGEWDADLPLDMARDYFARLTGARYRRWVEIGEGTHTLLLEANRLQLFAAVIAFLAEDYGPEDG